ncbi:GMP synthase [glutamine-hydrolyzing]-like [Daphnia magna]|uniref:GMP synthase [glutamine-hydrolyzing]-like n=1 Tax=Daphnia magna TaxID=35525 RepID=UPI001E1BB476|nr:GMP synthase [glutamine-hydrolyzing]-like [Daphnia magna]
MTLVSNIFLLLETWSIGCLDANQTSSGNIVKRCLSRKYLKSENSTFLFPVTSFVRQMWRLIPQFSASRADTHPQSHGVREWCVKPDILALKTPAVRMLQQEFQLSLHTGCPYYTTQQSLLQCREFVMLLCMQLLNKELGGTVKRKDVRLDGQFEIQEEKECPLFKGLETWQLVLLTHSDSVE